MGANQQAEGKVSLIDGWDGFDQDFSYYSTTGLTATTRRKIDGTWHSFDMTYTTHGQLDLLEYPTSTTGYRFELDYDYDTHGHLQYVKDGNETYTYYTLDETDSLGREREVSLGNGHDEIRNYNDAAGYLLSIATDDNTVTAQDLEFTYDEVGNVLTRKDDLIVETETFTYDDLNRLKTSLVTGETTVTMTYSAAGRITRKTDVCGTDWTYGAGSAGPFAVTTACGNTYAYDANGRMTTRAGSTITWYSYDKPKKINNGSSSTEFWYGPDRARYKQELRTSGSLDSTIRYVGTLFEFEDPASGNDVYRHYVHAGSRVVAMVEREDEASPSNEKHFLHRDHQGSVTKVTNASGTVIQELAYDAWGLRRDATDWSSLGSPFAGTHETERGYTGHEHLDTVGLIHMNGRVQDPQLGRFISADPFIQAPFNPQSQNRYSYVWNNPAIMIDPSGFETCNGLDNWDTECEIGKAREHLAAMWEWVRQGLGFAEGWPFAQAEQVDGFGPIGAGRSGSPPTDSNRTPGSPLESDVSFEACGTVDFTCKDEGFSEAWFRIGSVTRARESFYRNAIEEALAPIAQAGCMAAGFCFHTGDVVERTFELFEIHDTGSVLVTYKGEYHGRFYYGDEFLGYYLQVSQGTRRSPTIDEHDSMLLGTFSDPIDWSAVIGHQIDPGLIYDNLDALRQRE